MLDEDLRHMSFVDKEDDPVNPEFPSFCLVWGASMEQSLSKIGDELRQILKSQLETMVYGMSLMNDMTRQQVEA